MEQQSLEEILGPGEDHYMNITKEYIICAAIKRLVPRDLPGMYWTNDICDIEIGFRHHDIMRRFPEEVSRKLEDQGFYTSKGRYVNRIEGMEVAIACGQVCKTGFKELYSEDIYQ